MLIEIIVVYIYLHLIDIRIEGHFTNKLQPQIGSLEIGWLQGKEEDD